MNLNWNYLRYFEEVAKQEHFTRAADNLHITQSALSKSIDNLESDLGIPLFERRGRNVKLTRYGQILYNHVSSATAHIEKGLQLMNDIIGADTGEVHCASIFSIGASFIPDIIKGFNKQNPNIKLKFNQKPTQDILYDLLDSKIDLGFCGEFNAEGNFDKLEKEPILLEELLLAVPESHPLAGKNHVDFSDIVNESFIGYTSNTGIIHSIGSTLKHAGLDTPQLNVSYSASEDNTIISMVRSGLGIAFVADNSYIQRDGVSFLHVHNPYFSRTLYMVWKKNNYISPATKLFKYYILSHTQV